MVNLFRETAALDVWFMQLAQKSYQEGDAVWLTHQDCVQWWEESECAHVDKLPSQMNEDEKSQFDKQMWTALLVFADAKLLRKSQRQDFTPSLRIPHPYPTRLFQLSGLGKAMYRLRCAFLRRMFLFFVATVNVMRSQIRRYWWVVALGAAGTQLHRAIEFFGSAIGHVVGIVLGLLIGLIFRRIIDAFR